MEVKSYTMQELVDKACKVDEYEAKAKAFDEIHNYIKKQLKLVEEESNYDIKNNDYLAGAANVFEIIDDIIDDYESGESDGA